MFRDVEHYDGMTEVTYIFNGINEFIRYMIDNEDTSHVLDEDRWESKNTNTGCSSFNDCTSWENFINNMQQGKSEYSVSEKVFTTDKYDPNFEMNKDWYGNPDVPKALLGLPKPSNRLIKTKLINYYPIFINFAENCGMNTDDIRDYRLRVFEKINKLISERHTVDISIFSRNKFEKISTFLNIVIHLKRHSDNPDLNKLMYFVCGSDMHRRGMFRIAEFDPLIFNEQSTYAYGRPMSSRNEYIEKKFDAIMIHSLSSFSGSVYKGIEDVENRLVKEGR